MTRLVLWLFAALLLLPSSTRAATGIIALADCTTYPSPVLGKSWCIDTTSNTLKKWNGSAWVEAFGPDAASFNNPVITGTVTGGASYTGITATSPTITTPRMNLETFAQASLPAAPTAGAVAIVTDNIRGFWVYYSSQWFNMTHGVVDIKWFGAKGDGTTAGGGTDDTSAITAAVAATKRGGTLIIPPAEQGKCYRMTDTLAITAYPIRVQGMGWGFAQADSWVLYGSIICQTGAGKVALQLGSGAVGGELNGVVVENLAIGGTSGTSHAVWQRAVNRSTFRNIYIAGAGATGWLQDGGTTETQNILSRYESIWLSTGFGVAQGYAKPTTGVAVYSGPNIWSALHISGIDGGAPAIALDLDGPSSDGEGSTLEALSIENSTVNIRFGANSIQNRFTDPYTEGAGTISGTVSAGNRSNMTYGLVASGLALPSTIGGNQRMYAGRLIHENTSVVGGNVLSPYNTSGIQYGSIHASRTGVTNEFNADVEGEIPLFAHTDSNVDDVMIAQFAATGALADTRIQIGAYGSKNVGDGGIKCYRRSTGAVRNCNIIKLSTDEIATGSLPAGAASENGRLVIDSTEGDLYLYTGGTRYRLRREFRGNGSPEGVVTASVGELYKREDGATGTSLYVKESGTGNTGWSAMASGSQADQITSADHDSTTTTIAQIDSLSKTVTAGATYQIRGVFSTIVTTGGQAWDLSGTATVTNLRVQLLCVHSTTGAITLAGSFTALGTELNETAAGAHDGFCTMNGAITVNAGGTLFPRFAQQGTASGTAKVLRGALWSVK